MLKYIGKRLIMLIPVILVTSFLIFWAMSLTGGDPITARFMRQDFFTYHPQFTLLVAGNPSRWTRRCAGACSTCSPSSGTTGTGSR